MNASMKLGEVMYQAQQAGANAGADAATGAQAGADAEQKPQEDVVDADFEEVKK